VFPSDPAALRALPGVGEYTAGAVASICFEARTPAVDGNVVRVISRLTASRADASAPGTRREISAALEAVYPDARRGDFTQSLMELGATVCLPGGVPDCGGCPMEDVCLARDGLWRELPVLPERKPKRLETLTVLLLCCGDRLALRRRPERGLLAGLWELPNVPGTLTPAEAAAWAEAAGCGETSVLSQRARSHIFTHVRWEMTGFALRCSRMPDALTWASPEELRGVYALPTAFRQFLSPEK
jgi:A/G-specific adenine glycosylase